LQCVQAVWLDLRVEFSSAKQVHQGSSTQYRLGR
jgi:hypothetical protein